MIISSKYRYIFVGLPYSGSSAISKELVEHYDGEVLFHKCLNRGAFVGERAALALEIVLDRLPHVVELLAHQRRRQFELVALVERVEQLALELCARRLRVLLRDAILHGVAQLLRATRSQAAWRTRRRPSPARRVDRLRLDGERRGFAGHVGLHVVLRERRVHGALVAGLDADRAAPRSPE